MVDGLVPVSFAISPIVAEPWNFRNIIILCWPANNPSSATALLKFILSNLATIPTRGAICPLGGGGGQGSRLLSNFHTLKFYLVG